MPRSAMNWSTELWHTILDDDVFNDALLAAPMQIKSCEENKLMRRDTRRLILIMFFGAPAVGYCLFFLSASFLGLQLSGIVCSFCLSIFWPQGILGPQM